MSTYAYATAPVLARSGGRGLAGASEDLDTIVNSGRAIGRLMASRRLQPGCGRLPPQVREPYRGEQIATALCYQRMALIEFGFLAEAKYGTPGSVGTPAIQRLQRALGVRDDGDWGPTTNAALERVLGFSLPIFRKGGEPLPPPGPRPAQAKRGGGGGGLFVIATALIAALAANT